jgi:hypothetical protein
MSKFKQNAAAAKTAAPTSAYTFKRETFVAKREGGEGGDDEGGVGGGGGSGGGGKMSGANADAGADVDADADADADDDFGPMEGAGGYALGPGSGGDENEK